MGLQHADSRLRSGYLEGYGAPADMNGWWVRHHSLVSPSEFIFELTCDEALGLWESPVWGLWQNAPIYGHAGGRKWIVWLPLSSLSPPPSPSALPTVSASPLRPPLWPHVVCVVSNKEEISASLWPAYRGHREIYGVCLLRRGSFQHWPS